MSNLTFENCLQSTEMIDILSFDYSVTLSIIVNESIERLAKTYKKSKKEIMREYKAGIFFYTNNGLRLGLDVRYKLSNDMRNLYLDINFVILKKTKDYRIPMAMRQYAHNEDGIDIFLSVNMRLFKQFIIANKGINAANIKVLYKGEYKK